MQTSQTTSVTSGTSTRTSAIRHAAHGILVTLILCAPALCQTTQLPPIAKTANLSGPRFGLTLLSDGVVKKLAENDVNVGPHISQFGWQFEKQFYRKDSGLAAVNELVVLVGGLDQGVAIPSATWMVGLRTTEGTEFGVGPNIDYEHGNKVTGYEATATIRLVVHDLTQIGRVIDLALTAGATDVSDVAFESDSVTIGRRRALGEALAKARSDADALATAAGGSLGRLLEVSSGGGFGFASGARLSAVAVTASASRAAEFTPRDVVVQVSVQARWEFVAGR